MCSLKKLHFENIFDLDLIANIIKYNPLLESIHLDFEPKLRNENEPIKFLAVNMDKHK